MRAIAARNYRKIGNLQIYLRTSPVIGTGTAAGYVYRTTGTNFTRITSRPWLFTCFSISTAANKWHLNRAEIQIEISFRPLAYHDVYSKYRRLLRMIRVL